MGVSSGPEKVTDISVFKTPLQTGYADLCINGRLCVNVDRDFF
jgi:hypothetical protein